MTRQRRYEFDKKTRIEAFQRCNGHCEQCGNKILSGNGPEHPAHRRAIVVMSDKNTPT